MLSMLLKGSRDGYVVVGNLFRCYFYTNLFLVDDSKFIPCRTP